MNMRAFAILICLGFPSISQAQVRPRPSQTSAPPAYMQQLKSFDQDGLVTKVVLKNDLTVLVAEAHATPLVEVMTWIKAGTRDEPAGLAGISKVLERMIFRGTATRTAASIAADFKAMGGELITSTSYDNTSLRAVAPAPQWKKALEIQADSLLNPLLDPEELKRQIERLGDEIRRALGEPQALMDARLLATGFAGDRLKQAQVLSAGTLGDITRDKLLAFYRSAYSPARTILIVCGDVIASDVLNSAVNLYAGAKGGVPVENRAAGGEITPGLRYEQVRGNYPQARVVLGFRTVAASSADYPALEMLRAILAAGEGAVLNRRLRHQKRIIDGLSADLVTFSDGGYLSLRMDLDPRDFDRCEIAAFTELEILKQREPDLGELERARAQLQREFWEVNQTVSGRAARLARLESWGSWKSVSTCLERLNQVKWADIARVAARYLSVDNCAVVEYLPAQAESRNVQAETIKGTIQYLLEAATKQEVDERDKLVVPALDVPEQKISFTPSDLRRSFQTASILRGPDLFIREDHTMPLIHLGLFFPGGKLLENKTNAGITSLLIRTMLRDGKNKSAEQIYRQLEVYGGALTAVVEDDYFGVNFSILSPYVEQGLDLLGEVIRSPKLDPEEIEHQKAIQLTVLRNRSESDLARRRLLGALYQDHSYALDADGSAESLAGITPEAVQAWHKAMVADKKPMVVIIGDTQGSSLASYFVRNFSGSRIQSIALPEKFAKAPEKRDDMENHWGASFSSTMISFAAPPEEDEDSFAMTVLRHLASGLAGRLTGQVLERVRSAFDVSMEYAPRFRGGSVTIRMSAAPADEEQAWKVLTDELIRLTTVPIQYREYRSAVNSAIAELQLRQQERGRQIAEVIKSVLAGKGIEGFQEYASRLEEVKQTDLQETVKRIFRMEKSVTLRLHGKSGS
jgi:zinc protease